MNPAFIEYQENHALGLHPEETWKLNPQGHPLGLIPSTINLSHLKRQKGLAALIGSTSIPSSYDLRTYGRVSPVKNQASCGDCWAFATYGSLESTLLPNEIWNFSENNLSNLAGFDNTPCVGGNSSMSIAYMARWGGPVSASDDPDPGSTGCTSTTRCTSAANLPVQQHLQNAYWIAARTGPTDNANLKAAIMAYGGVEVGIYGEGMYSSSAYWKASTNSYFYNGAKTCTNSSGTAVACGTDHAVTLIGWDDNYLASNFSIAPAGNGAFLIKNSWGTYWGASGFAWVSYYDAILANTQSAVFADSDLPSGYTTIYQYDPLGQVGSTGYGTTSAYMANIFTASASGQLQAVSTYANSNLTAYTVKIYTNPTSGPTSGTLAATTGGTIALAGYNTIVLPASVAITQGKKFSVVVQLTTPNYTWPVPISYAKAYWSSKATAKSGQGFISSNGSSWTDVTSYIDTTTSICLKAFATDANGPVLSGFTVTPATVSSGGSANLNIALSAPAPSGGTVINLVSNNTSAFPVYSSYAVPAGQTTASFSVVAGTVTAATAATVTASDNNGRSIQTQVTVSPATPPVITSVTTIQPGRQNGTQQITITGKGFGTHAAYNGNSSYIEVNLPAWSAGYKSSSTSDAVWLNVTSWTDTQIVLAGFTNWYGGIMNGTIDLWVNAGDPISVEVWNAQTGGGPSTCTNIVAGTGPTTCTPAPAISVTPSMPVAFDSVAVGSSFTQDLTVQNTGGGTLTGTATVAAPFSIVSGGSYSLPAGQTQTVEVEFSPTVAGPYAQPVSFTGGAGASQTVTGTGTTPTPPAISVTPTTAAFGSVTVGSSSTRNFTVQNTGGGTLTGTATVAAPFSVTSGGTYSLAAGATQTVTVTFTPTAATSYSQAVSFTGGAGASLTVTGTGTTPTPPAISVTPTTAAFGSVTVGSSSTQNFTVQNTGGGTLTGTATVAAPFSIVSGGSYSLAAGATQTVAIKFSPTAAQSYSQTVSFTGGAGASRTVTGAGTAAPSFTVSANASSRTITKGQSASFTLTVQSKNGFNAKVTPAALNLPTGYVASGTGWNPSVVTPAANGSVTSTLTVVTNSSTTLGTYKVTLQAAAAGYTTQSVPVTIIVNPAAKLPTATTSAASAVTASTTTLNATVNPNGADTKVWFLYGTSSTLSGASQTASLDLGSGRSALAIAVKLTGLKAKQLYHYQVVAQNSAGTVKGAIKSFTTLVQLLPSVATTPATAVKSTTATINGTVNANGADTHTWFLLSTNKSMSKASKSGSLDVGSSSSLYSIQCPYTGLSASTTYYYEIVAQNSAGTSTGAVKSFTTTASSKKSNEPAAALTAGKISRAE